MRQKDIFNFNYYQVKKKLRFLLLLVLLFDNCENCFFPFMKNNKPDFLILEFMKRFHIDSQHNKYTYLV